MKKKQLPIIITVVALILIGLVFLFGRGGGGKNYNWWEHYRPESKDPYGAFIVQNLLKSYFPGETFTAVEDSLAGYLKKENKGANYVFIGSYLPLDSLETDALLDFVERGNHAFIASATFPTGLLDSIILGECIFFGGEEEEYPAEDSLYLDSIYEAVYYPDNFRFEDSVATLNFSHPDFADKKGYLYKYVLWHETAPYTWDYLPDNFFCEEQTVFTRLGFLRDSFTNFVKADFGKGAFYLHTTPIAFTNFNLVEVHGLEYAAKVFSHLSPGPILYDKVRLRIPDFGSNRQLGNEGPLKYILSQPPLAWAWYILLAMALLYLIFRAKRKQRIIPVLEQNVNTSLEFIGTIGRLYFLQNNHKQLALQKMKLFLGFVRERYHLSTRELDEPFIRQLAIKSEIPQETLEKIVRLHRNIKSSGYVSENVLTDFHRLMERFYRNCK